MGVIIISVKPPPVEFAHIPEQLIVHQKKKRRVRIEDIAPVISSLPDLAQKITSQLSGDFPLSPPSALEQKVSRGPLVPKESLSTFVTENVSKRTVLAEHAQDGGAPYIFCNEQLQTEVIQMLQERDIRAGVHLGFSGWFNFDIMAATIPSKALVCDINKRMLDFYEVFQSVLLSSSNREEFVEKLQKSLDERSDYFDNGYLWQLPGELTREGSWLSSDEGFAFIKELHQSNRVEYRFLDATGDATIFNGFRSEFGDLIKTVYASNIYEW